MQKVLIVGGAGYVGSVLTQHLLREGNSVVVLDNFVYQNQFAVSPYFGDSNYRIVFGSLGDKRALEIAAKGVDSVVILGGLVGDPITKSFPVESAEINEKGVRECIDFFDNRQLDKLIFVSTCSNYGLIKENELAHEKFELNPLSLYAKAKVSAEKHVLSKKEKVGYDGVVLRFATAFGLSPRMRFDLTVSEFTRDLYFGQELVVFDEHTWRPYCHVRDFSRLISKVLVAEKNQVSFEIFNAGGEINNFTKKMIVDAIVKQIPTSKISYNQKGSDPRNYRVSFEKVKSILDFTPSYSVEDGIKELIEAFDLGLYADSNSNRDAYGNYSLKYTRKE